MPESPWDLVRTLGPTKVANPDHAWEPRYGNAPGSRKLTEDRRVQLAAVVEDARRKVCLNGKFAHGSCASDYKSADENRCDCKYGRFIVYTGKTAIGMTTEMTGCPELRELVYHLLHGDIDTAEHRIEDLGNTNREQVKVSERYRDAAQNAQRLADARLEDLNHQNDINRELADRLAAAESEAETLAEERDSYRRQAEDERDRGREWQRKAVELEAALVEAEGEAARIVGEVEKWQRLYEAAREQREGFRENSEAAEQAVELLQAEIDALQVDSTELREECEELEAQRAQMQRERDDLAVRLREMDREIVKLRAQVVTTTTDEYVTKVHELARQADTPDPFYVAQESGLVPGLAEVLDLDAGVQDVLLRAGMVDEGDILPAPKPAPRRPRSA
jgi:predicted RNase H-like nuclease (RuvC/YqgF family)